MRAVVDANIVISAFLSPTGSPAQILRQWQRGAFELVVSPLLLGELERALRYPKLRKRISREEATAIVEWLQREATIVSDPRDEPPVHSPDPGDDYLIALAAAHGAMLVSGDEHLLGLAEEIPVYSAAEFLDLVADPQT